MNQLMGEEEAEEESSDKAKGIRKKDKKEKKKRGRPNKKDQDVPETDQLTKEQVETVLHKLIVHIAWAYRYILPEEISKQSKLKSHQN